MKISILTHMTDQKEKRTVTTMTHAVILDIRTYAGMSISLKTISDMMKKRRRMKRSKRNFVFVLSNPSKI